MAQLINSAPGNASELQPVSGPVLEDEKVMSLAEHLTELRRRLIISIAAISVGGIVGWFAAPRVMQLLKEPITPIYPGALVFTNPGSALLIPDQDRPDHWHGQSPRPSSSTRCGRS